MTEDQLQQKCVMWFDATFPQHRQMLFAVPNGGERPSEIIKGKRVSLEANKLKSTGVRAGVADLVLVLYMEVVFIELKVGKNDLSPDQVNFKKRVEDRGHSFFVVRDTLEEFKELINKLIL